MSSWCLFEQEAAYLAILLKAQKGIHHLELQKCTIGLKNIMLALSTQAVSLSSLCFIESDFDGLYDYLMPLTNLKKLEFKHCLFEKFDLPKSPELALTMPNLSILRMDEADVWPEIVEKILGACTSNMKEIRLGKLLSTPYENHATLMSTDAIGIIASRFQNLTFLKIALENNRQVPQIISMFAICRKIETVILCQEGLFTLNVYETNEMLDRLGRNGLPRSLRKFALHGKRWSFTSISLENFLKPAHSNAPILKLEILGSLSFTNGHIEAIIRLNQYNKVVDQLILSSDIAKSLNLKRSRELD
ncbi:3203_t:CDS:1, partial [Acaulospora colombiana]